MGLWRPILVLTVLLMLIGLIVVPLLGAPWWVIPAGIVIILVLIFSDGVSTGVDGDFGGGDGGGD